jgi:hypothetical protein
MRTIRIVTLLAAVGLLVLPGPAAAGGPTSVLITEPGSGKASALHYEQSAYAELERLLQEGEPVPAPDGRLGSTSYTLTWMIHDVKPWRLQFVHPDGVGGPLVGTQAMTDDGSMGEDLTWLKIADGETVQQLLEQTLAGAATGVPEAEAEAVAPEPTVVERVVQEPTTEWFSLAGWRWVLPGLLVGALLGLVVGRRRDDGPQRVLTDTPQPVGVTGSLG